jgi:hypothetical protein
MTTCNPFRRLLLALSLLLTTALVACGGGDDGAASEAADKYVGRWSSACTDLSTALGRPSAYQSTLTLRKTGATSYASKTANVEWANASCTGPASLIVSESGATVFTIVGTKVIGSDTVDQLSYPLGGSLVGKSVALVSADGLSLRLGNPHAVDSDGYPTTLDTSVFTRQ